MTSQQRFDRYYVASVEILSRIGLTSSGLTLAQQRGKFPKPTIVVGKAMGLWERDILEPFLRQIESKRARA